MLFFGINEGVQIVESTSIQRFPVTLETTNLGKQREWNEILESLGESPIEIVAAKLSLVEVQHINPAVVAVTKAHSAFLRRKKPVMVEDVSFGYVELGGAPGALYGPLEPGLKLKGIHRLADLTLSRRAVVTATIAFVDATASHVCVIVAKMDGTVPKDARGENGFGFDPIFIPEGYTKTLAEMTAAEKNAISMRRMAIEKLVRGEWEVHDIGESQLFDLI